MEEFRTLRTRLNHMKSLQPIHTVVVTSPSPAEGKVALGGQSGAGAGASGGQSSPCSRISISAGPSFTRCSGSTAAPASRIICWARFRCTRRIKKIAGTNLYIMPAGEAVINPLELLNLREVKQLLDRLPTLFNWIILDSPPLLFAADANLLSTLCHGTLLVVRIGHTTIDSVTRAMQSLCNNNVLGIVVNGARRGELYSKYTYYHSYYTPKEHGEPPEIELPGIGEREAVPVGAAPGSSGEKPSAKASLE